MDRRKRPRLNVFPNRTLRDTETRRVVLNNKGMPTGEIEIKSTYGGPIRKMTIGNYVKTQAYNKNKNAIPNFNNQKLRNMYAFQRNKNEKKKFNARNVGNMYEIMTPEARSPQYLPVSPNYTQISGISKNSPTYNVTLNNLPNNAPIGEKLNIAGNTCKPPEFLYRKFRINSKSNRGFFNYVMSNNKNGFKNVIVPNKNGPVQPGIIRIGSGKEGMAFVGCIDKECKEKVAIKASLAMKSTNDSQFKRNYKTAPGVVEFKIQSDIASKVADITPHVVTPYALTICAPEKSFVSMNNNRLKEAKYELYAGGTSKAQPGSERIVVAYYEFFNGGDITTWLQRHSNTITELDLKTILFQVTWTLNAIYKKDSSFRHNDLHMQNIFVKTEGVPRDGTTKYGQFEVPNRGIFTAIGDFGWAHTSKRPNPRVMSGLWKQFGLTPNKTERQDFHFFLYTFLIAIPPKFSKIRSFIIDALGKDPELLSNNSKIIKNKRLIVNNNRVLTPSQVLNSEYFSDFKYKSKPRVAPKPKPAPRPQAPEKNIVRNIKKMINSADCGKKRTKSAPANSVLGMSVDDMIKFIKTKGTEGAKNKLKAFKGKKPKRAEACAIIKSFREGKKLLGINVGPSPPRPNVKPAAKPAPKNNNANNNGPRAFEMNKAELENFILEFGTNNAREQLANATTRSELVGILRSFARGKAVMGLKRKAQPQPPKNKARMMVIPKANRNEPNITARVRPNRKRPAISTKPRVSANQRRLVQILANRYYNMNNSNGNNFNAKRNSAVKKAQNQANKLRAAGFSLNMETINNIAPARDRPVAPLNAAAIRAKAIRKNAGVARTPRVTAIKPEVNFYRYEMEGVPRNANDVANRFYIEGKKAMGYNRNQLNRLLRRVGANPATVKTKKDAVLAIARKRASKIKPRRNAKKVNQNRNNVVANARKEYLKRLSNLQARRNAANAARRAANAARINNVTANVRGARMGRVVKANRKFKLSDMLNRLSKKTDNQ